MVQGIETVGIEYTKEKVGVCIEVLNGASMGRLKNPNTLLKAADKLIKKGAQAIAVVCFFGEDSEDENYACANGVDPIGGIEAIISHLIAKEFNIPTAHSPAFCDIDISLKIENPKVSSELISSTYLPCIMQGLSIAPKISKEGKIKNTDVEYLIVPNDALGSCAVLSSIQNGIKVITVKNDTVLNVTNQKLKFEPYKTFESYEQCLITITKK